MNKNIGRGRRRHPKLQKLIEEYAQDESINGREAYDKYLRVASAPNWKVGIVKRVTFYNAFYQARRSQKVEDKNTNTFILQDFHYRILGIPVFSKRVRSNI